MNGQLVYKHILWGFLTLPAANSGHRFSQLKLGVAYLTGEWKFSTDESDIPVATVKKGWELIQMAADQGAPDAIFMLENK